MMPAWVPVWVVWIWLVILGVTALFGFGWIITPLMGMMKSLFFSCVVLFTVLVIVSFMVDKWQSSPPTRPGGLR